MASEEDKQDFEYRRNPPKFADQGDIGMSDNPFGGSSSGSDNPFGSSSGGGGGDNPFGGGGGDNPFGGGGTNPYEAAGAGGIGSTPGSAFGAPTMPGQMGGPQQPQEKKTAEDVFYSTIGGAASGSFKGAKSFSQSFGESNASVFAKTGNKSLKIGMAVSAISLILLLMSIVFPIYNTVTLLCGGLVSSMIGLAIFGLTYEKAKEEQDKESQDEEIATDGFIQVEDDDDDDEWEDEEEFDDGIIEIEDDDNDDWLEDDDEDEVLEPVSAMSLEEAKERLTDLEPGMQTRAHLFERYSMVLPNLTPKYDEWTVYEDGEEYFVDMESYLREAAEVTGIAREDDMPYLSRLRENYFIIQVTCDRPNQKFKAQETANELAKIYGSRVLDDDSGDSTYARVQTSGREVTMTIFKGTSNIIVTLKDTYKEVGKWVSDPSVKMPVVLGINEIGKVWTVDFSKIYSALISGMPRSGKSWETTAILLQIAMYCSPREVNYYVCDTKNDLSDYQNMNIPHIKEFAGTVDKILSMLDWIVNVEGPRRKRIIGSESDVNYNDFISKFPEKASEIPRLYFIIDEMMALTSELSGDGDRKKQFNDYLRTIVSQFPGMGIYFIGIPHRVNDKVVPKDVYALVPCNIAVMAEEDDIKNAIGATKRDFPYALTEQGESALKISGVNKGRASYSRGIAVATENEDNRRVMEFIRAMWSRLDHEYYHGPRQDFLDKKKDIFDGYNCGCESHGGVGNTKKPTSKGKNRTPESLSGDTGPLSGISGGYTDDPVSIKDAGPDITDDWDEEEFPLV